MTWSTRQPAMWLENGVRRLPGLGDAAAGLLLLLWVSLDCASMLCRMAKVLLMRRWARELVREVRRSAGSPEPKPNRNAAGLGGMDFGPVASVAWSTIYQQCDSTELHGYSASNRASKEYLFFTYFGPLEAWCEANCVGTFYLWTDSDGVNRVFTDPTDVLLWNLTFNGSMPSMRELNQLGLAR